MKNHQKGRFRPTNYKKYQGDPTNIIYRSGWELRFMKYLDNNPSVLEWSSEEICIPYISPIDNRPHRYFPDFKVKIATSTGGTKTMIVEIKPHAQTIQPKVQKRKTRKYITEVMTWGVNEAKWKAAREWCLDRKYDFIIMDEYMLGIKDK